MTPVSRFVSPTQQLAQQQQMDESRLWTDVASAVVKLDTICSWAGIHEKKADESVLTVSEAEAGVGSAQGESARANE